jgi:hypothetical protein
MPPVRCADVPVTERQGLFIRKLKLCCVQVDFSDIMVDVKSKEIKRIQLLELVDYINSTKNVFNEGTFPEVRRRIGRAGWGGLRIDGPGVVVRCAGTRTKRSTKLSSFLSFLSLFFSSFSLHTLSVLSSFLPSLSLSLSL